MMRTLALFGLSLLLVLAPEAWAQGQNRGGGNTGGGNTGGGNTGGGNTGGRGGQGGQGQGQQRDPFGGGQQNRLERPRPVYLSGQVMIAGGQAIPDSVVIERICNGRSQPEAYTDQKGRFSFELGGNAMLALSDASVGGPNNTGQGFGGGFGQLSGAGGAGSAAGMGRVNLSGCELRAVLAGFRSDSIQLGYRSVFDNPDVGVILLHPLGNVRGALVSATNLNAPKKARSNYEKGMKELRKKRSKPEKAIKAFEKAVAEYPEYAAAWAALGETRMRSGDVEGGAGALEKALEADPKFMRPYYPLIQITLKQQKWERLATLCDSALNLNPGNTQLQYYKAVANLSMGDLEAAAEEALAIQKSESASNFPQTHQMMGHIYAQKGEFPRAAEQYRAYLEIQPEAPSSALIKQRLTEWVALGVIEAPQD